MAIHLGVLVRRAEVTVLGTGVWFRVCNEFMVDVPRLIKSKRQSIHGGRLFEIEHPRANVALGLDRYDPFGNPLERHVSRTGFLHVT